MIIQCEACQTRFRLAAEKVKPGGTKVRCSKCKTIFTVVPPAPEPVDEAVDFGAFNMERVTEDTPAEAVSAAESQRSTELESDQAASPPWQQESSTEDTGSETGGEADFSAFEDEMGGDAGAGRELADDFAFADTPLSTGDASAETETAGPSEFSFEDEDDAMAFNFDDTEEETAPAATEDFREPDEFSFDDAAEKWGEAPADDDSTFDFDEPQFTSDSSPAAGAGTSAEEGGLHFGEIDFAGDSEPDTATHLQADADLAKDSTDRHEEPEPHLHKPHSTKPSARDYDLEETILTPSRPQKKKSSLTRILTLLVLLLVVLGGAAGYLYMQGDPLNLSTVARYLPFLKDYLGEAPPASPGDRIGINITGSSYVNGKAGQMLVVQGAAVNNHTATRSAITIKGVLLDAQGKKLLQQTVFCGNKLDEAALKSMPFAAIEEAMNNQFGDSLSNMNVAAGASIPFTIVFRNLPAGIANINVEVVDSKPGAG